MEPTGRDYRHRLGVAERREQIAVEMMRVLEETVRTVRELPVRRVFFDACTVKRVRLRQS